MNQPQTHQAAALQAMNEAASATVGVAAEVRAAVLAQLATAHAIMHLAEQVRSANTWLGKLATSES